MGLNLSKIQAMRAKTPVITISTGSGDTGGSSTTTAVSEEENCYLHALHPKKVLQGLNEMRNNGHFCDVTLIVDGRTFPAHKAVLASCSPYFRAMFLGKLAESHQEQITLSGVDAEIMALLIDYAYTSVITITKNNVQSLLSASNLLEVAAVRGFCCRFLERQIDSSNCLGIHCFAEAHACHDLAKKSKAYIFRNFSNIVTGDEWLSLPVEKVVELITADELELEKDEQLIFSAVDAWLHHNFPSRSLIFNKVVEEAHLFHLLPDGRHLTSLRTRLWRRHHTTPKTNVRRLRHKNRSRRRLSVALSVFAETITAKSIRASIMKILPTLPERGVDRLLHHLMENIGVKSCEDLELITANEWTILKKIHLKANF